MAESEFAPLLRRLGFDSFQKPRTLSKKRTLTLAGTTIRKGPRPWEVTALPCFIKVTGSVKMTIVIDECLEWWVALKDIPMELYRFHRIGSASSIIEEDE